MSFDSSLIMPTQLMVSMLKQANNGEELLAILDTITTQSDKAADIAGGYADATLDSIDF